MLHRPSLASEMRTIDGMKHVVAAAREAGLMTSEADRILREHGLHAVDVSILLFLRSELTTCRAEQASMLFSHPNNHSSAFESSLLDGRMAKCDGTWAYVS